MGLNQRGSDTTTVTPSTLNYVIMLIQLSVYLITAEVMLNWGVTVALIGQDLLNVLTI